MDDNAVYITGSPASNLAHRKPSLPNPYYQHSKSSLAVLPLGHHHHHHHHDHHNHDVVQAMWILCRHHIQLIHMSSTTCLSRLTSWLLWNRQWCHIIQDWQYGHRFKSPVTKIMTMIFALLYGPSIIYNDDTDDDDDDDDVYFDIPAWCERRGPSLCLVGRALDSRDQIRPVSEGWGWGYLLWEWGGKCLGLHA